MILDEAQDTDAEMFAILTEIARPDGATPGTWPEREDAPGPAPGRFSFVGDDQQAIYSDRANLAVYRRYIEAFKAGRGGRHLEFSVTMRCPQRVIRVVNEIFAGGRLPQPFVEFRELSPRPDCPDGASWRLPLAAFEAGEGRAGVDARVAEECRQIARFLVAHGRDGLGIKHWSEVAVIGPRVRWLERAAAVFAEHGLPGCLLSQKRVARELPRHSWPAALFHVLVHPWDRFELIGVLREIFAVSDVDLARLHRLPAAGDGSGLVFWPQVLPPQPGSGQAWPGSFPATAACPRTPARAPRVFPHRCAGPRPRLAASELRRRLRHAQPLRRHGAAQDRARPPAWKSSASRPRRSIVCARGRCGPSVRASRCARGCEGWWKPSNSRSRWKTPARTRCNS